jgi:hypothetical protein
MPNAQESTEAGRALADIRWQSSREQKILRLIRMHPVSDETVRKIAELLPQLQTRRGA